MAAKGTFYKSVVAVTRGYLGPAADRFVARQVHNHLGKEPEQLLSKDLAKLTRWLKLSMACVSEDKKMIDQYVRDLKNLMANNK